MADEFSLVFHIRHSFCTALNKFSAMTVSNIVPSNTESEHARHDIDDVRAMSQRGGFCFSETMLKHKSKVHHASKSEEMT